MRQAYKNLEPAWSEPSESIMHLSLEQKISPYLDGIRKKTSLKPNTQYPGIHHLFTGILDDHGLCQIVEEPTRGSNVLDLIVTNYPSSFRRTEIIPGVSDHDIVFTEVNIFT
jgi:hypothetical protein